MRTRGTLLFWVIVLLAAPGRAEPPRPAYLLAYTGLGITRASDLFIRQPRLGTDLVIDQVSWEHRSLSTDWDRDSIPYVGVRAGLFLSRPGWLSVSAEVLHFKVFAKTDQLYRISGMTQGNAIDAVAPMGSVVQRYQVSNGVNMVLGNLSAHWPPARDSTFAAGWVGLYGGGGAGVTVPFTRSTIGPSSQGQYEWGRLATQLFGGVAWRLTPRWSIAAEYKLTGTTVDGAVPAGSSESRLQTHHLVFGLGFLLSDPDDR